MNQPKANDHRDSIGGHPEVQEGRRDQDGESRVHSEENQEQSALSTTITENQGDIEALSTSSQENNKPVVVKKTNHKRVKDPKGKGLTPQKPIEIDWDPTPQDLEEFNISSKITNLVVARLRKYLKMGIPVRIACRYAGISKDMFYRACRQDLRFATLMENAIDDTLVHSHMTVNQAIREGDPIRSMEYIKARDERFQTKYKSTQGQNQTNIQFNVGYGPDQKEVIEIKP